MDFRVRRWIDIGSVGGRRMACYLAASSQESLGVFAEGAISQAREHSV